MYLGMTRQNVAQLTAAAVIEQRSDGRYDQTASRLRYIAHLRSENRRSPRAEADAAHAQAKTELMRIRIEEQQRQLVRREAVDELIDAMAGTMLTHLVGHGREVHSGHSGPAQHRRGRACRSGGS